MRWLIFFLVAGWLIAETWVFLAVGAHIGLMAVIGWMVLSFLLGLVLLRFQGWQLLFRMHRQLQNGVVPAQEMLDGAGIVLGAILLMLPGYLSDLVGLLFLVPPARQVLLRGLGRFFTIRWSAPAHPARTVPPSEEVLEIRPDTIERDPRFPD
jgi:UPF0716 protein FxsA